MMKQNTTNEATIVLHINRDASVAYLCVRHIRFGILERKTTLHVSKIHEQWQQNETYNCQFKTKLYVTGSDVTECEMPALAR